MNVLNKVLTTLMLSFVVTPYAFSVEDNKHDTYCEVYYTNNTSTLSIASEETENPAIIALGRVSKTGSDSALERVSSAARRMQAEYQALNLNVIVEPYLITEDCAASIYGDCFNILRDLAPKATHYHVWGGFIEGLCGQAFVGGTTAWTSIACGVDTLLHEQGHNFFLQHSGEGTQQYGWKTWMGAGYGRSDYNTPNISVLGTDIVKHSGPGTYFLTTPYVPRYEGETHLVRNTDYFASIHKGRVRISRGQPIYSRSKSFTWLLSTLRTGEMVRIGGTNYQVVGKSSQGSTKVVIGGNEENIPFPKPPIGSGVATSGLWSDPKSSHQGFLIFKLPNNHIQAYWMTWNLFEDPRWYILDGTVDDLKIYRTKARLSSREMIKAGQGQIRFDENGVDATFDAWIDEPRTRVRRNLKRTTNSDNIHPLAGHWGFGKRDGLVVQAASNGTLFGYWLKYDIDSSVAASGPQQQWLMVVGNDSGMFKVYEPKFGRPGVSAGSELQEWGEARFDGFKFQYSGKEMGSIEPVKIF